MELTITDLLGFVMICFIVCVLSNLDFWSLTVFLNSCLIYILVGMFVGSSVTILAYYKFVKFPKKEEDEVIK